MWSIKSILLLGMLCLITMSVSAVSVITAPTGTFQLDETKNLPVTVAGLSKASGVNFNMTYDQGLFYVDAVTASSSYPNAAVTTNVDNTTGLIQVAVTDTDGITATGATPLVDITFRNRGGSGTTAVTIPNAYWSDSEGATVPMSGDSLKAFDRYPFATIVAGSLEAKSSVLSEIRVGTGVLSSGASVRIPVSVANVTNVNNITISIMHFNSTLFVIEDVVVNNSVISGSEIVQTESLICNVGGSATIQIKNDDITASTVLVPVVDLVIRPTDLTGAEDLMLFPYHTVYSTPTSFHNQFSIVNAGQVVTSGAGSPPGDGAIRFLDTSIEGASTAKYPIEVKLPVGAKEIWAPFTYDAAYFNVTAVVINATANTTYGASIIATNLYPTGGQVNIGNTQELPTTQFTPVVDVSFKTFTQYGITPFSLMDYGSLPNYKVSSPTSGIIVTYPFKTVTHGNVTVTPKLMPDLVGEIIDAPKFVKKWKDDSLHFNTTFAVHNIGYSDVTNDFEIQGRLGNTTQKIDITDDIPAHQTLMMYMKMNVIPNLPETEVKVLSQGLNKYYTINTSGDIGVGSYNIGIGIDVNNAVGEVNETNNDVNTTAPITRPDLIPTSYIQFVSSSGSTVVNSFEAPGTYTINYGVKNMGDVFAVPTSMNVTIAGTKKIYDVPVLQPGAMYNLSQSIQITKTSSPDINITVNDNRSEAELNYNNNTYLTSYQSIKPVTINLPKTNGTTEFDRTVNITLTNVTTTITDITFPFRYDPTVCYVSSITGLAPGISASQSYGRVVFTGSSLGISSNATIGQVNLRARTNDGRSATLTSDTSAVIKTDSTKQLDLIINSGTYNQVSITDARLSVWVPTKGPVDSNQTISLSVYNYRSNTVFVNVNVTVDGVMIWQNPNMSLSSYQSRYISIPTWKPTIAKKYWVNATLTGDDLPVGNTSQASILIEDFQLNITDQNKQYWEWYYGYNKTVFINNYFWIGTYYSSNQGSMINGTMRIWDQFGNPVNLADKKTFDFYYYYPPFKQWYGYSSDWNSMAWYSIKAKKIGVYNYSITLDSRGKVTFVNGTIIVQEPFVDIKVVNSTTSNTTMKLFWNVFINGSAINKQTIIKLAAGSEGRTLQGLNYLTNYPYGCPEQVMSPTLATLRVLQYSEKRGILTTEQRNDYNAKILQGVRIMSAPGGSNAQQLTSVGYGTRSGGWAWGKNSQPSMFYTMYPNYVLSEVYMSNQTHWGQYIKNNTISFNESVAWLINKQQVTKTVKNGSWQEYGYIYDPYIWTGWCMLKFDHEYDLLSGAMKARVNLSMQNATFYLLNLPFTTSQTSVTNDARAFTILGLKGIENRTGPNAAIDAKVENITAQLLKNQQADGSWNGGGYWYVNKQYTTAQVLKALNATGSPYMSDNETIRKGIRYLVSIYNTGGRWSNTATTAGVMEAIIQLQPEMEINGTADVTIYNDANTIVKQMNGVRINNTNNAGQSHTWQLSAAELGTLYTGQSGLARVEFSNWQPTAASAKDVQLVLSVDSRMQLPISIARGIPIPEEFIDPIADNFSLSVQIPTGMKEGDTGNVGFTINNNFPTSDDQYVMIVNVPVNAEGGATYVGSMNGTDMAYYIGNDLQRHNLSHQFNSTDNTVAFFPGSDNETAPSILAGQSMTYYLPLKFNNTGNMTVQARAYPMYNDEWMALGNGSAYVKGYGNITLQAVDQTGAAIPANFFVNNTQVATATNTTSQSKLEGTYAIAIQNSSSWVNVTLGVSLGETATYTARFVTDTTVPYAASVTGGVGDVNVMPPTTTDSVSNSSANHWNAAIPANKTFNSSIVSGGGIVTVAIDITNVTKSIGTIPLNETINIQVHNNTAPYWYNYPASKHAIQGNTLFIYDIDSADIDKILIEFMGRKLGDVDKSGFTDLDDAIEILKYEVMLVDFTNVQCFYADTDDSTTPDLDDAINILKYEVFLVDANFNPFI